ncbi:MAG: hypothetical protein QF466_10640 [Desulfobacterales bacterium]|jgi:hypothetical protein|nr:hypothetical protein [Desulfobacterales bacterium]MDP6683358.1 hypothetical protein [Desulfobacterales bacterium]MDP6808433.1 hypothetical protein [Desulfobacterales bacterium]|tara:strand:+ start:14671 stop:14892 length:222 start_codon:yes stop_codon:yes gene_type:complete
MAKQLFEWDYSSYPRAKIYPHLFKPIQTGNLIVPNRWKDDQGGVNRLREAIASDLGPTTAFNETRVTIHKHVD